jgi:hypothetical protein
MEKRVLAFSSESFIHSRCVDSLNISSQIRSRLSRRLLSEGDRTLGYTNVFGIFSPLPNEPVEKVTFLKTAPSAESKIGIYFLSSKVFTILGAMFVFS